MVSKEGESGEWGLMGSDPLYISKPERGYQIPPTPKREEIH